MFQSGRMEITAFAWDKSTYEKLGFISDGPGERPLIHMVHQRASCTVLSMLLELGENGFVFHGNTELPPFVFVADGRRSIIVQTLVASRLPVISVMEDGRLMGYEQALEYCGILAKVKESICAVNQD